MTTKAELADLVADYAHRTDLLDRIKDVFIDLAGERIGRELKSGENETILDLTPTSSPIAVPDDYGAIRSLVFQQARGPVTLTSLGLHSINNWAKTGGTPARYAISARQIEVRPFIAGDFTLTYYARPALPLDTSENDVLDTWLSMYRFATLIELNIWAQDSEQLEIALTGFTLEVADINKDADRARGEKPAMRRA